jgi:hypothetical protein
MPRPPLPSNQSRRSSKTAKAAVATKLQKDVKAAAAGKSVTAGTKTKPARDAAASKDGTGLSRPDGAPAASSSQWRFLRRAKPAGQYAKLPSSLNIFLAALRLLKRHWKLFLGITLIYAFLNLLLVHGLSNSVDMKSIKTLLAAGKVEAVLTAYALLITTPANTASQVSGLYQAILLVIGSLAIIWGLRQAMAGAIRPRIRDAFYQGMYPLVPVLVVLLMIGLQLLPLVIGASLYSLVMSTGIAAHLVERIVWFGILLALGLLSLYLTSSSVFGLYIAALPDMTPVKALRSGRELVRGRYWSVIRKLLFLPLVLALVTAAVVLPVLIVAAPVAPFVLFLLSMAMLPIVHAYLYKMYRELLP